MHESLAGPPTKSSRVLACVLCQQRKVRCDRKNPCSNCVKARVDCKPATIAPRRRRKQFSEKSLLLDRLKKYEDLLHQHGVNFEPLWKDVSSFKDTSPSYAQDRLNPEEGDDEMGVLGSLPVNPLPPGGSAQAQPRTGETTFWNALGREFRHHEQHDCSSDEDYGESKIHSEWDRVYRDNLHFPFGTASASNPLTSLHPQPTHIFQLWQIYLNNVQPLLKIFHVPTQQQEIIEASRNLAEINPGLEALLFGIYCVAIVSMTNKECVDYFGDEREKMSQRYLRGCQQALVNAEFLRSIDLRVLISLLLYLYSICQIMDPRSISTMIGMAVRIAQRIGLHSERCNNEYPPFEAEMRRRLWWQIVLFDSRIGERAHFKASILAPDWDCKIPLNVNDSDLFPHCKEPAVPRESPTESLYIALACEMADFVRRARFYLEFFSPFLTPLARDNTTVKLPSIDELEGIIEAKYLKHCDPQNPLHLISSCMSRISIGKWRLGEYVSKHVSTSVSLPETYRDKVLSSAISMIELDILIHTSPLTQGFRWFANIHFPMPTYIYLVKELKRRTTGSLVDRAWEVIATCFETRNLFSSESTSPALSYFRLMSIKAWEARKSALEQLGEAPVPPKFISIFRALVAQEDQVGLTRPSLSDITITGASGSDLIGVQHFASSGDISFTGLGLDNVVIGDSTDLGSDLDQFGFRPMDWSFMGTIMGESLSIGIPHREGVEGTEDPPESAIFGNWS